MYYSVLHCHFESALRALAIAKADRLPIIRSVYMSPAYHRATPAGRLTLLWQKVLDLTDAETIFTEDTFRRIVQNLMGEMTSSFIEHIDLRVGPSVGRWQWMGSPVDGLDIFQEELDRCCELSITFLAGVNMTKSQGALDAIFNTLLECSGLTDRIAGIDINFLPADLPKFGRYLHALRNLQAGGLKINIHLGELFDNETSRYVLSRITPDRIGHGVLLLQDKEMVEFIRSHKICLDMCPTSNTVLGVVDWDRQNPARRALELGIPVSINTDDPMLFDTNIAGEIRRARLTDEELDTTVAYSRKHRYENP